MIKAQLAAQMARLTQERAPFVLATVVRARRPTSVRPGDTAVVTSDATISGFVGGQCAESSVRLHSLRALETGEPLLLRLIPGDGRAEELGDEFDEIDGIGGAVVERNPCLSGGAMEIFLEPQLPDPRLVVVGESPIAQALAELGASAGYEAARVVAEDVGELEAAAALVVASHGHDEERLLAAALLAGVPYVGLVASPTRGTAVRQALEVPPELAGRLHTPAGLDIGARTPAEIAVSILAEVVAEHHADPAPERPSATLVAEDPICGMKVVVAAGTPYLDAGGERVYFCGRGCREAYATGRTPDARAR